MHVDQAHRGRLVGRVLRIACSYDAAAAARSPLSIAS